MHLCVALRLMFHTRSSSNSRLKFIAWREIEENFAIKKFEIPRPNIDDRKSTEA